MKVKVNLHCKTGGKSTHFVSLLENAFKHRLKQHSTNKNKIKIKNSVEKIVGK